MKNLLLSICCVLLCLFTSAQTKNDLPVSKADSGKIFRFVDMTDINGKKITAKSLAGKTVVVDFWFIGCPPCIYEMPYLSKIADEYQDNKNVVFIAFSTDSQEALKEFFKTKVFNFQHIANTRSLNANYGVETCPRSFVINKDGKILFDSKGHRVAETPGLIADALKNAL